MKYLNVSLTGLRGRHHPALTGIVTTVAVQKSRIHLKMLAGDYLTYEVKSKQSGGSPHCRCCPSNPSIPSPSETISHIIASCVTYSDIRNRIVQEYRNICSLSKSGIQFENIYSNSEQFCQFVLDPASFNLSQRVHINDPILNDLFKLSRDLCFGINSIRQRILKEKETQHASGVVVVCV